MDNTAVHRRCVRNISIQSERDTIVLQSSSVELDNDSSDGKITICDCGSSSVVERDLAKVEVASSTLVSRSISSKEKA